MVISGWGIVGVFYFILLEVSPFPNCEYKSENNFVSRIEKPSAGFSLFWRQNPDFQVASGAPLWPGYLPSWLTSHSSLCLCLGEPWEGAPPVVLPCSPKFKPLLWSLLPLVCVSICTHPIGCNRTRLSPLHTWPESPVGGRESPFSLCAQHLSQHLVPSCVECESNMKGKRRAERRAGGETERVPN